MQHTPFLALILLIALAGNTPRAAAQDAAEVLIVEPPLKPVQTWTYTPATLTVKAGTTLTWRNTGGVAHTVTADDGKTFESGNLPKNATFSLTATAPGSFSYHCKYHKWMKATIVVVP